MNRLQELYRQQGQSPWLDNLQRSFLREGTLAEWVSKGVRGVTSNPTIFQKAITGSSDYDEQLGLVLERSAVEDAYWELVMDDVRDACDVLRPVHDRANGTDGFVSLEVAPSMAHDADSTVAAARWMYEQVDRPNLFVKVPASQMGVSAVRTLVSEGRDVNITLIFGLPRYGEIMEAYLSGLEQFASDGGDLSTVRSVASFFVSRVDTEVDRRLEQIGTEEALGLRGRAAVAQAKLAYRDFLNMFSGPRWDALEAQGAHRQRPLWASTSTKNDAYPDLLYVDSLIGPDSVNTMPDATLEAFVDHGTVARTVDADLDQAEADWQAVGAVGVDLDDVSRQLEYEALAAFSKSFDELLQALSDKTRGG